MKDKKSDSWFPFWVDKWIFGSTRIELSVEERAVWIDLLALAAKDNGYIRANEGVPYPREQLAGMLLVPLELLNRTIQKCASEKIKKLEILQDGTLKIINWQKYELSKRHKQRFSMSQNYDIMSENNDIMSEKYDTKNRIDIYIDKDIDKNRLDIEKKENNNINNNAQTRKKIRSEPFFNFDSLNWENITEEDKNRWKEAYPACDIDVELAKMREWVISNGAKGRKKNWRKFITNWLSRCQDRGGSKNKPSNHKSPFDIWLKRRLGEGSK